MSRRRKGGPDEENESSLDDVPEEEVEAFEEGLDTEDLDEDELVTVDDAARALLAKGPKGHGPIARLYRGETRFDFVGRRRIWFAISTLIIVLGIVSIVLRGGLNLGIEFKGGTEWTIAAPNVTQTEAANAVKGTGLIDPTVELLGTGSKQTLNVQSDLNKLPSDQQDQVSCNVQIAMLKLTGSHNPTCPTATASTNATTTTTVPSSTTTSAAGATTTTTAPSTQAPKDAVDKISITTVGPTWGSSITNKAIEALIIFFIVVAIYISIRFEPKMALAAFIAMIHDVLVAVGIYSIFNFQVTPDTVVAILTILGYSLYDTVVVFDRVRDNTKGIGGSGRLTYPQLINLSMNQTLARSINTSAVAIIPVLAILVIGAQILGATTLQSYGLALFVGLLSGAYSSIFIASPVLCMMKEREDRWQTVAQRQAKRGEDQGWYSAVDAANLTTNMNLAASGQVGRAGRAATKPRSAPAKRTGPIRPGSAGQAASERSGNSGGNGSGTPSGNGHADMDGTAGDSSGASAAEAPSGGVKPRKAKGKRRR